MKIVIEVSEKCTGCGECRRVCPRGPLIWKSLNSTDRIVYSAENTEYCFFCKNCASRCPAGAIKVKRK